MSYALVVMKENIEAQVTHHETELEARVELAAALAGPSLFVGVDLDHPMLQAVLPGKWMCSSKLSFGLVDLDHNPTQKWRVVVREFTPDDEVVNTTIVAYKSKKEMLENAPSLKNAGAGYSEKSDSGQLFVDIFNVGKPTKESVL